MVVDLATYQYRKSDACDEWVKKILHWSSAVDTFAKWESENATCDLQKHKCNAIKPFHHLFLDAS